MSGLTDKVQNIPRLSVFQYLTELKRTQEGLDLFTTTFPHQDKVNILSEIPLQGTSLIIT